MSRRIVRQSKFRHIFGEDTVRQNYIDNIRPSRGAGTSDNLAASEKWIGIIWESIGGGSFAVIDRNFSGKLDNNPPLVNGHQGAVLDLAFSPFDGNMVASCSEDCTVKLWSIPEEGLKSSMSQACQSLEAHVKRVCNLAWHPHALGVLASSSSDRSAIVWDIESGQPKITLDDHTNLIQSLSWSLDGKLLATTCQDKIVRVFDPRANKVAWSVQAHEGSKGTHVSWTSDKTLVTSGFTKYADRQLALWEVGKENPQSRTSVDNGTGILVTHYDADLGLLYLTAKGSGNVKFFEINDESPYIHKLGAYSSQTPMLGGCFIPKRAVDTATCELARFMKLTKSWIEPISIRAPRRGTVFQADLYPDTNGTQPGNTAAAWFSGSDKSTQKVSVQKGGDGNRTPSRTDSLQFTSKTNGSDLAAENERLKARIAELEAQLSSRS